MPAVLAIYKSKIMELDKITKNKMIFWEKWGVSCDKILNLLIMISPLPYEHMNVAVG
jgi:hypothetical protein